MVEKFKHSLILSEKVFVCFFFFFDLIEVFQCLKSMILPELILNNPVYKYNLQADFEIAIDENFNFVDRQSPNIKYK